jgi:UDP-N-acetyl-D-galactosamine dehydrogenase
VVILGITFKENCPDIRNSKAADIINRLNEYGIKPEVVDPQADECDTRQEYGINLLKLNQVNNADCLVFAVAHDEFKDLSLETIDQLFGTYPNNQKVIIDVKSILDKNEIEGQGYSYWRL